MSIPLHSEIVRHHDGYTCGAEYLGEVCRGNVTREVEGKYVYFECEKCGLQRAGHVNNFDEEGQRQAILARAGLPTIFFDKRFEGDANNLDARRLCTTWLAEYEEGPLPAPALFGDNGRGKSHLLTAICERLINQHEVSVMFRSHLGLIHELQQEQDKGALRERLASVSVLALDDLGAVQQVTDWREDELGRLVDERYQRQLPILLATNYPPLAWEEHLGPRTASRLQGMTLPVELRGPDRREREEVT